MATTQDYATLSLYVYNAKRPDLNLPLLPTGWSLAEPLQSSNIYGFSCGVFRSTSGEIVVAYTGTNENIDWASNIGSGGGLGSPQMTQAALVYLRARDLYGSNITLTGHSLGGGLASVMSVWFDRPAVVFDHAPFELSARNPLLVAATQASLALFGYDLGAFLSYGEILNFATRELNVSGNHLSGEALQYLRMAMPTIGTSQPLDIGGAGLDSVQLHSMALYVAAKLSPAFVQATLKLTTVLPVVMDSNLYASNTGESADKNFLLDLIRSEQQTPGNGKLSHFAADLNKLGSNVVNLNSTAQKAILAQAIEWYYWQPANYSGKEFFTVTNGALQYTTAIGDELEGAQNKAATYIAPWISELLGVSNFTGDYTQWTVSAGGTVTATALDGTKRQLMIGNTGDDDFTGGDKADYLIGGAGDDELDGGLGADIMVGGQGDDTYTVDDQADQIIEAAGQGADTVESSVNYALGAELENLTLTGTAITGAGNAKDNHLKGNDEDNNLDGGKGADTLEGGLGDDTYIVDDAGDQVIEQVGEGEDIVSASVDYTLGADVENLVLTGTATRGTGNELDNVMVGNDQSNTLDGQAGADTMSGGAGDDLQATPDKPPQPYASTKSSTHGLQVSALAANETIWRIAA